MAEPSRKEDVPALCKAYFVSLSRALMFIYIVGTICMTLVGSGVAYALKTNSSMAVLQEKASTYDKNVVVINQKLDYIISHGLIGPK